jgi:hypothetical protein
MRRKTFHRPTGDQPGGQDGDPMAGRLGLDQYATAEESPDGQQHAPKPGFEPSISLPTLDYRSTPLEC